MTNEQFNECMCRVKTRDVDALKAIYNAYFSYVYQTAYALLQQKENAEDIASDVFMSLWDKAGTFKPGKSHKGWLATITRNLAIDFLRKNGRVVGSDDDVDGELSSQMSTDSFEDDVLNKVTVEQLLSKLSSDQRLIIHLKFFGKLTLDEIAKVMEIPVGTVNWKYAKARELLRRYNYA